MASDLLSSLLARGTKRKTPPPSDPPSSSATTSSANPFSFSSKTVQDLALQAEEAALKQIELEQAAALKAKLPDFWLPSLTPTHTASAAPQSLSEVDDGVKKLQTVCRGGESHPLS